MSQPKVKKGSQATAKWDVKPLVDPKLVSALSHPLRVCILDLLSEAVASPSDLAREAGLSVDYIAYHVKELEKLGYVELVKTEPRRGTVEHYYRASQGLFFDDPEWEQLPTPIKNGLAVSMYQVSIDDLKEALTAGTYSARNSHMSNARFLVDEQGWDELKATLEATLERVLALQTECAERLEAGSEEAIPVAVSIAGFETPPRPGTGAEASDADD